MPYIHRQRPAHEKRCNWTFLGEAATIVEALFHDDDRVAFTE